MYRVRIRTIVREHPERISSKADLQNYYRRVSSTENLDRFGISPWLVISGVPLTMFISGLVLNYSGADHALVTLPALIVVWFDIFILLFLMFWGEKRLLETLIEIQPAFALGEQEYYRFVGRLFQRLYEPSPFAGHNDGIQIHLVSIITYCFMSILLLVLSTQLPEQLVVVDGSGPSIALQAYVVATIALVSFGLCHGLWTTGCLVWFMGIRAQELPIRLNAARTIDNLGLRPYGKFILHAALIGFSGLIMTGFGYLISPHSLFMVVTGLGSVLFIGWYVGAQYGLHRSMVRAKKDRIDQLNKSYGTLTEQWSSAPNSETRTDLVMEMHSLLGFKREIEELPTWPGKSAEFAQIVSAAKVSYIPFYLHYLNVV